MKASAVRPEPRIRKKCMLQSKLRANSLEHHQGRLLVAERLEIWDARELHHRRWPAHDRDGGVPSGEQVLLKHTLVDETGGVLPFRALWHTVHGVGAWPFVDELSQWALDINGVADLHRLQMLRHLAAIWELGVHALEIDLDHEIHVA